MKKIFVLYILAAATVAALALTGCGKEKTPPGPDKGKLEITGSGTAADPFLIDTWADLAAVGTTATWALDKHYKLTADITVSGAWTPIAPDTDHYFTGTFDGNGRTITFDNVTVPNDGGLFAYVQSSGVIKKLKVAGNITGTKSVGAIANYSFGTITCCVSTANVAGGDFAGGIVSGTNNNSTVKNCYSTGTVTVSSAWPYYAGGIAHRVWRGTVEYCYARGNVTNAGGTSGGITGTLDMDNTPGNVRYCVAMMGSVAATGSDPNCKRVIGSVAGSAGEIANNYANSAMTVNGTTVSGTATDKNGADATLTQMQTEAWWKTTPGVFSSVWGGSTPDEDHPWVWGTNAPKLYWE